MLLLLSNQQIFTPEQALLTDCYTQDTLLTYNRNINQITIDLSTSNNSLCSAFPSGIIASLSFKMNKIPILRRQIENFTYEKADKIIFSDVPKISKETFVILHLYSYSLLTEVIIFTFQEQKSALNNCFLANSSVNITTTNMTITLESTNLCTNQFLTDYSTDTPPVVQSQLISATLFIQGQPFDISVVVLEAEYTSNAPIVIFSEIALAQSSILLQLVNPTASIEFISDQGGTQATFYHEIGAVNVKGFTWFWSIFENKVGCFSNQFLVKLYYGSDIPKINLLTFDSIMFRLTGQAGNQTNYLQQTFLNSSFDKSNRFFTFSCNQGKLEEKVKCEEFYLLTKDTSVSSQLVLDIIFYDNGQFVHVETSKLHIQEKQVDIIVSGLGFKSGYFQIISLALSQKFDRPQQVTVTFTLLDNSINLSFVDTRLSFSINSTITSYSDKIEFDCDKRCETLMKLCWDSDTSYYSLKYTGLNSELFGFEIFISDYRVMYGIVISLGVINLIVIIVMSIINIIFMMKSMRSMKKRKR